MPAGGSWEQAETSCGRHDSREDVRTRRAFLILLAACAAHAEPQPGESATFGGMEFVWIPRGDFVMESNGPEADDDERPLTPVRISRGSWMGKCEVTREQWEALMGPTSWGPSEPEPFTGFSVSDCPDCAAGSVT